jgi:outer membrane protein OmpA-like peptidoglycan-associated protein
VVEQHDWNLDEDSKLNVPHKDSPLLCQYTVRNPENIIKSDSIAIPIKQIPLHLKREKRVRDTLFQHFSLILFDFNKSDISGVNAKICAAIKRQIAMNLNWARITGYADRTGNDEGNKILSENRANAVRDFLGIPIAETRGLGSSFRPYPNDLPEGRFYCRTVEIDAKIMVGDQ